MDENNSYIDSTLLESNLPLDAAAPIVSPTLPSNISKSSFNEEQEILANDPLLSEIDFSHPNAIPINDKQVAPSDIFREGMGFDTTKGPGFIKGIAGSALDWMIPWQAIKLAKSSSNNFFNTNPAYEYVPENWTPINDEALLDIPEEFRNYIVTAKSPNDQRARREEIIQRLKNEKYWNNTPWYTKTLGAVAGIVLDPVTKFMPAIVFSKYASVTQDVAMNVLKNAPAVTVDTFSRVSLQELNKKGNTIQDAATQAFVDSVYSVGLIGAGRTIGVGYNALKLWDARNLAKVHIEGVGVRVETNDKGIVTGHKAYAIDDSVGAQRINEVQGMIDERMAKTGAFGLPIVGENIYKGMVKGANLPIIRALAPPALIAEGSSYHSFRSWFNRIGFAGPITEGVEKGRAREITAEEISEIVRRDAVQFNSFYKSKFMEANGINSAYDPINALKSFKQKVSQQRRITENDFGQQVNAAMISKEFKSDFSQVHEIAEELHKTYQKWGIDYKNASQEELFLDPRNAWRYMPFNYNIPGIKGNRSKFIDKVASQLQEQYESLQILKAPIDKTKSRLDSLSEQLRDAKALKGTIDESDASFKNLINQKRAAQKLYNQQHDEMVNKIRDNSDHQLLLQSRVLLDSNEIEQLRQILTPSKLAEQHLSERRDTFNKLASELDVINDEITYLQTGKRNLKMQKQKSITRKSEKTLESKEKKIERLEKEQATLNKSTESLRKKIAQLEQSAKDESEKLFNDAISGKINKKFLKDDTADIQFRDPDESLKFRDIPSNRFEQEQQARAWMEVITNSSPEHILRRVLGKTDDRLGEGAAFLKERTLMLPGKFLNDNGFLSPDVMSSVRGYANVMGRLTGFKRAFPEFAHGHEFTGVLESLNKEHNIRINEIENKFKSDDKKRLKELGKADKEFVQTQKYMNDMFKIFMGNYGQDYHPDVKATLKVLRNVIAATKLTSVPLYQISELGAMTMKHGAWPKFIKFVKPQLQSFHGWHESANADVMRKNAYHARLAMNHLTNGTSQQLMNSSSISEIPIDTVLGKAANFTEGLAHVANNIAGTNYITNIQQMITATKYQSKIMQAAYDAVQGKLLPIDKKTLAMYGIDIEKDAKIFVDQFEKYGGFKPDEGSYMSMYYNWGDLDASRKISESIFRATEDTILKKGLYTSPLWTNDPLGGAVFMFHGWAYSAFNRYTIPLMQQPNAQAILGALSMFGTSMFIDPAMKMINGQDPTPADDEEWFASTYKAFDYSGLLGPITSYFNDLNLMTGLFPKLVSERMKYREPGFNIPGPIGGYLNDMWNSFKHIGLKGDYTERDFKKAARLFPFMSLLPLRAGVNKAIESMSLPQTRKETEPYSWWPNEK